MTRFSYHRQLAAVQWGILGVSVVEAVVISLVLHRWPTLAWLHVAISVAGIVWTAWYMHGQATKRHEVDQDRIRLRYRHLHDIELPRAAVGSVRRITNNNAKKTLSVRDGVLRLAVGGLLNLRLDLVRAAELDLPGVDVDEIHAIELFVDDTAGFIHAVRAADEELVAS